MEFTIREEVSGKVKINFNLSKTLTAVNQWSLVQVKREKVNDYAFRNEYLYRVK